MDRAASVGGESAQVGLLHRYLPSVRTLYSHLVRSACPNRSRPTIKRKEPYTYDPSMLEHRNMAKLPQTDQRGVSEDDVVEVAKRRRLLSQYDASLHFHTSNELEYVLRQFKGLPGLDLGCGDGRGSQWLRQFGITPVGLDIEPMVSGQLRGDGGLLPFKDEVFPVVLTLKVLEHVREPSLFVREIHRVLRPSSLFIGSVAFMEPYHARSYYHFSPLAVVDLLSQSGFVVIELRPGYSALGSIFSSAAGSFLKKPAILIGDKLGDLMLGTHRTVGFAYAKLKGLVDQYRRYMVLERLRFAGEFSFVAVRRPSMSAQMSPRSTTVG